MDDVDHGYQLANAAPLVQQALTACNQSHAPYSQSHSGIALESFSGQVFTGRYAENAAFNSKFATLTGCVNRA